MYEFHSVSWWRLKGRGFVASIKERTPEGLWSPGQMTGTVVKIDGEEFLVKGVEMFMIMCSPDAPYKLNFALLVEEVK